MTDRVLTLRNRPPHGEPAAQDEASSATPVAEFDRVQVLADVTGDDGARVSRGSVGTVVAVWGGGAAFEVEFTEPVDTLATVPADLVRMVERTTA